MAEPDKPSHRYKFKRHFAEHRVDSMWCWCDPVVLMLCPVCDGDKTSGKAGGVCFSCRGTGLQFSDDPDNEDQIVVHRETTTSPFG